MALICTALLLYAMHGDAVAESSDAGLRWGRPNVYARATASAVSVVRSQPPVQTRFQTDDQIVLAAWDEDDASSLRAASDEHRSIVVERNSPIYGEPASDPPAYDPFDEEDRLAQLPEDPFDDPFDDPEADSADSSEFENSSTEDNLDDIEAAVEQEIERRRAEDDLAGDANALDEMIEPETDVLDDVDPMDEATEDPADIEADAPLSDDPEDEELLQSEEQDWDIPEFDLKQPDEQELTPEDLRQRSEERQREREESEENCREEIEKIEADTISSIDLSIRVPGNAGEDFPYECSVSTGSHQPRQWCEITYNWKAAAICHKPLYFEQVQLERYGHSWGPYVQPIMSGVHFFSSVPLLPYKMGIRTPRECVYTLGYYRPGSCAPYMIDPIPFTWRAALLEGAVATGIPLIVP